MFATNIQESALCTTLTDGRGVCNQIAERKTNQIKDLADEVKAPPKRNPFKNNDMCGDWKVMGEMRSVWVKRGGSRTEWPTQLTS
jgi:hypothetical protein